MITRDSIGTKNTGYRILIFVQHQRCYSFDIIGNDDNNS